VGVKVAVTAVALQNRRISSDIMASLFMDSWILRGHIGDVQWNDEAQ
jgi:hypothetical protein